MKIQPPDRFSTIAFPVRAAILAGLILIFSGTCTPSAEIPYGLSKLVREAVANNREIQSLEEKARALREEAPFAGSLKDPSVGIAISNLPTDSFVFDQEPMTQKQISLDQQIPWFANWIWLQDWFLRYELTSVPGVAEVASIGGFVKQYQVVVDPNTLVAYNIPLQKVRMAI